MGDPTRIPDWSERAGENGPHGPFTFDPFRADGVEVTPVVVLAAWSVLSFPAALAVGAILDAAHRRTSQPVPVPVRGPARRSA